MSFSCPAQFAALPSDLFLLQPQFPYHLFKAVLLCFQDLVQTLEFLDQKRRQECTLLTQLGKSSPLTMSGTFNMSYVEPWGVQFHHTFVQRQLEGIEGWLRISRHPEVPVRLPGTWKSQTCSLHRSALLHIYGRSKAPWESWTQHACTISRHPHVQVQKAWTGMWQPQHCCTWSVTFLLAQPYFPSPLGQENMTAQLQLCTV